MQEIENKIREQIAQNPIIIYIKGSPQFPQCGFSAKAVQILKECGKEFAYINILENPDIRATLPKMANWPTFPQLYIKGELIGGCDIMSEMHAAGELKPLIDAV
ncbi:MAG: glutaredoxin-like protein [Gammaproteobacteria bacterium]|jgi:monothiol glutaredoxin|nr:glutaredoxin-like protein [Gammaproteobacteria bacterium]